MAKAPLLLALEDCLSAAQKQVVNDIDLKGVKGLETYLASLPRKIGREYLDPEAFALAQDLARYRHCDLAAAVLLARALGRDDNPKALLRRLYDQGDAEERQMILLALPLIEDLELGADLLLEAHRTNDETIFLSAFADSDLPARILQDDDYFRAVLKCAFCDLDPGRLKEAESRANITLTAMLMEFKSEREAAGRPVWRGTWTLGAHAPTPGFVDSIRGKLWHGSDESRREALNAVAVMGAAEFRHSLESRLEFERRPEFRRLIADLLAS